MALGCCCCFCCCFILNPAQHTWYQAAKTEGMIRQRPTNVTIYLVIYLFVFSITSWHKRRVTKKKKKLALFVQQLNLLWWVVSELQKQINKPKSLTKKIPPCNFIHDHHGAQPWALMQPNSQRGLVLVTAAPPGTWSTPAPWRSAGATFLS